MTEYLARSAEAEYGVVFEKMAKREGEHCGMIAELLGSLDEVETYRKRNM